MLFKTINEIKEANRRARKFFFSPDTMRFFASQIESDVYGGKYFITSEKSGFEDPIRQFAVREATETGDILTVAKGLPTKAAALNLIEEKISIQSIS